MAAKMLCLETLGALNNGAARLIVDAEIAKAITDLEDRGEEDKQPRKVTITLVLGMKEQMIVGRVSAQAVLPARSTGGTLLNLAHKSGNPVLVFQEHNAERPDQATFPEMDK